MSNVNLDHLFARAKVLYTNGFGYQNPSKFAIKNHFIIARTNKLSEKQIETVRDLSNVTSFKLEEWLGKYFVCTHYTEYDKIDILLNSLLALNISFQTHNKLQVYFDSNVDKEYNQEIAELKCIENCKQGIKLYDNNVQKWYNVVGNHRNLLHIWNWYTTIGKLFCVRLRNLLNKEQLTNEHRKNYYNWTLFQDCDLHTLMDIEPNEIENKSESESENENESESENENENEDICLEQPEEIDEIDIGLECMICMDNLPNTRVYPCEHVVVCKDCSKHLENTVDKDRCVRCRQEITRIELIN